MRMHKCSDESQYRAAHEGPDRSPMLAAMQRAATLDLRTGPAGLEPAAPDFGARSRQRRRCRVCLIFHDLALDQQRRRCWTPPALALILAVVERGWSSKRNSELLRLILTEGFPIPRLRLPHHNRTIVPA